MVLQSIKPNSVETEEKNSEDLAVGAFNAIEGVRMLQSVTETELKYALSAQALNSLQLENAEPIIVTQYYLPDTAQEKFVDVILAGSGIAREVLPSDVTFTQVRVRWVEDHSGESFYLQAKAKLPDGDAAQKIEIGTEISREEFKALRDYSKVARGGMIKKSRYKIAGELLGDDENIPVVAEVDVVLKAGPDGKKVITPYPLASVDIEVSELAHLGLLRTGRHTFTFLNGQVLLTDADPKLQKSFSTSGLGKKGVSDKTIAALIEINS